MTLEEVIDTIRNSERICITTTSGCEVYRGYRALYIPLDKFSKCTVNRVGVFVSIFKKNNHKEVLYSTEGKLSEPDNITHFRFSDLDHIIYTRIIIEV